MAHAARVYLQCSYKICTNIRGLLSNQWPVRCFPEAHKQILKATVLVGRTDSAYVAVQTQQILNCLGEPLSLPSDNNANGCLNVYVHFAREVEHAQLTSTGSLREKHRLCFPSWRQFLVSFGRRKEKMQWWTLFWKQLSSGWEVLIPHPPLRSSSHVYGKGPSLNLILPMAITSAEYLVFSFAAEEKKSVQHSGQQITQIPPILPPWGTTKQTLFLHTLRLTSEVR